MSYSGQMISGIDSREYCKLLSFCGDIVKAYMPGYENATEGEIYRAIEAKLGISKEGKEMSEEVEFLPAEFEDRHRIVDQCARINKNSKAIINDLSEIAEAHLVLREDYKKLLAKYNGVFEWVYNNEGQLPYLDTAEEIKTSYEGSLK